VVGLLFSELALAFQLLPGTRFCEHRAQAPEGSVHAHAHHGHAQMADAATHEATHAGAADTCDCGRDCSHCMAYYVSLLIPLPPLGAGASAIPARDPAPRHHSAFMSDHPVPPPLRPPIA